MGTLSIVATPIGNMGDMTFRGLWVLKEADCIYAEDTRVTLKLLTHYGLRKPLYRLDAATEAKKAPEIVGRLERGEHIAYVSDAGTPGLSDPGARLVAHVREEMMKRSASWRIETIPGPSALAAALSVAGVAEDAFLFLGFLPHKKGRQTALKEIGASTRMVVLFESPHRILKLLKELDMVVPKCQVTLARELTKIHEEVLSGTPREVERALASGKKTRGEFVILIKPLAAGR